MRETDNLASTPALDLDGLERLLGAYNVQLAEALKGTAREDHYVVLHEFRAVEG